MPIGKSLVGFHPSPSTLTDYSPLIFSHLFLACSFLPFSLGCRYHFFPTLFRMDHQVGTALQSNRPVSHSVAIHSLVSDIKLCFQNRFSKSVVAQVDSLNQLSSNDVLLSWVHWIAAIEICGDTVEPKSCWLAARQAQQQPEQNELRTSNQ